MIKSCLALLLAYFAFTGMSAAAAVAVKTPSYYFENTPVTALVTAIADGDFVEADKALKSGADVNTVGAEGISPLLWVMGTTLNVGKIEYLLKAGANPNYRDSRSQVSPMYLAAGGDRPDILELLLKHKGDPNLAGKRGETLLMVAVMQFRDKNVDLLMRYGADINLTDELGDSVASRSARMGRFDQVVFFLERGLTYDVQRLARTVDVRKVPADSEKQRWKDRATEMLKARGAAFPTWPSAQQGAPADASQATRR